ncbi:hypothetical protein EIP91_002288 [Steccherinum ochraceum]|uniref:DUF6533 domain-containing protein n=1 Tax=Steccherinum ochraceum TaxID=92696 RepID=A0A4R0REH5_9APHY|nr:hypothetical protein EIP91_002288 [Steccherinum ochraceum]
MSTMNGTVEQYTIARVGMYASAVPLTLAVYDYALTLPSEVKYIWPSRMSVMKILYFMTKYLAFFDTPVAVYYHVTPGLTQHECKVSLSIVNWILVIAVVTAEAIMMIRTWVVWERSERVGVILGTTLLVGMLAGLLMEGLFTRSLTFVSFPFPSQPSCFLLSGDRLIVINPAIVIVMETAVFLLTLIKAIREYQFRRLVGSHRTKDLIYVFYRDGLSSYVYLIVFSLLNFILIVALPAYGTDLAVGIQRILHSCISARVLINLREAAEEETATSMFNRIALSDIAFADALADRSNVMGPSRSVPPSA